MEFLKNPGLKKKRNTGFALGSEYVKPSEETQERFEDLCQFITTTERQHEGNEPEKMNIRTGKSQQNSRDVPTGMSHLASERSSALDN